MTDDPIGQLGGVRPAARKLGVPVTTVFNWTKNGIPGWRRAAVDEALHIQEDFENLNRGRGDDADR